MGLYNDSSFFRIRLKSGGWFWAIEAYTGKVPVPISDDVLRNRKDYRFFPEFVRSEFAAMRIDSLELATLYVQVLDEMRIPADIVPFQYRNHAADDLLSASRRSHFVQQH